MCARAMTKEPGLIVETLSAENERQLEDLVRLVDYARGLTIFFAVCNLPTQRRDLAELAKTRLEARGIAVVEVLLEESITDLREVLAQVLPPADGAERAVLVYGLEHSIPSADPYPAVLAQLNATRELFHRDAPYPLVLWLPDYALTKLARSALDFWAWRSGVFEFAVERPYQQEALQTYVYEGAEWATIDNLTGDQKRRRRAVLENLLAEYEALEQDPRTIAERLHILFTLAQLNQALGDVQQARELYQQSLKLSEELGDRHSVAISLHQLALLAQYTGHLQQARDLYQQSLQLAEDLGDRQGIAQTLHNLALLAQDTSDLQQARDLYQQSLRIKEELGDKRGIANTLHQLALLAQDTGGLGQARNLYRQSLQLYEELGDKQGIVSSLHQLALLTQDAGDLQQARNLYQQSLQIKEELGDKRGIAISLHQLGQLAELEENAEEAAALYQESLRLFEALGSPYAKTARRSLERVGNTETRSNGNDPIRTY